MAELGKRMPRCVGTYEPGDAQCDGNTKGADDGEKMPCVYRDRCVAMKLLVRDSGRPPEYFVRVVEVVEGGKRRHYAFANNDNFKDQLNEKISRYSIKNGVATSTGKPVRVIRDKPPRKLSPEHLAKLRAGAKKRTKAQFSKAGKARSIQFDKSRAIVTELAQWYTKSISASLGRPIRDSKARCAAGELFLVDRGEKSGYAALYARPSSNKNVAITSLYYRPATNHLEVRIACDYAVYKQAVSKSDWAKLGPDDFTGKDGAFKVRIRAVDKEKASIIADTLVAVFKPSMLGEP